MEIDIESKIGRISLLYNSCDQDNRKAGTINSIKSLASKY